MNTSDRWSPSKSPTSGVIPVGTAAPSAAAAAPSATGARWRSSCAAVGSGTTGIEGPLEDGSYVVRFEKLDLSTAAGRAALLAQVERSAAKLCEGVSTRARREACAAEAVKAAFARAPDLARTIHLARLERDGQQQAQR